MCEWDREKSHGLGMPPWEGVLEQLGFSKMRKFSSCRLPRLYILSSKLFHLPLVTWTRAQIITHSTLNIQEQPIYKLSSPKYYGLLIAQKRGREIPGF